MSEIFFLFSRSDPSLLDKVQHFGAYLIVNRQYRHHESLEVITEASKLSDSGFNRFYILPEIILADHIVLNEGTKPSGEKFQYIMDRVGAAALDLTLYDTPAEGEVAVGSLAFHQRIYSSDTEPLQPSPSEFASLFRKLRACIRQSASPIQNSKTPKTVFAFPGALAIMQRDPTRSPWASLSIPAQNPSSMNGPANSPDRA